MKKIMMILAFVAASYSLFAVTGAVSFSREGIGAEINGMGGAGTAGTEGVNSVYWNPAGLTRMGANIWQLGTMYTIEPGERYYGYLGAAVHSEDYGDFGISFISYGISDIELFDETGTFYGNGNDAEFAGGISYANKITYQLRYGLTVKGHYQDLVTYKATGYSVDMGVIFQPLLDREIYIGVMLQNIMGQIFWTDYSEDILSLYKAGVSAKMFEDAVKVCVDAVKEEGRDEMIYRAGIECRIFEYLFIRGGIDGTYPTAGAGIRYGEYMFDYSYTYDKYEMGDIHQFSLVIMW